MNYLQPADYAGYGLSAETPDALVASASAMIDGFCRRASLGITTYVERVRFSRVGTTVQLSNLPLTPVAPAATAITAARVRLRRPMPELVWSPLQEIAIAFGLGGSWSTYDPSTLDVTPDGIVYFQPNLFGMPFDEAELTYTAGYAVIPAAVKTACAQIVRNAQATPALTVKSQRVDTMQMEYFSGSLLDTEVQRMLQPFVSERVG